MDKKEKYGRLYIISFALAAAMMIRAYYLETYFGMPEGGTVWDHAWLYYALAFLFFLIGVFLLFYRK
jgi:hypothetical protein